MDAFAPCRRLKRGNIPKQLSPTVVTVLFSAAIANAFGRWAGRVGKRIGAIGFTREPGRRVLVGDGGQRDILPDASGRDLAIASKLVKPARPTPPRAPPALGERWPSR